MRNIVAFPSVADSPLLPVNRSAAHDVYTTAIKPGTLVTPWRSFIPEFFNRWAETLVSDVSTPNAGLTTTPGWTLGDSDIEAFVLRLDNRVYLRLYIILSASAVINTLVRDNGTLKRTGDRGNTFMHLPYKIAAGTGYQLSFYAYTSSAGAYPGISAPQSPYNSLPRLAPGTDELPISAWDQFPNTAVNPVDGVGGQGYWRPGEVLDLQFEYETDDKE